jgi:hypothetical protein
MAKKRTVNIQTQQSHTGADQTMALRMHFENLNESNDFFWGCSEVGITKADDVASDLAASQQPCTNGFRFPFIFGKVNDVDATGKFLIHILQDLERVICRSIIDKNDLEIWHFDQHLQGRDRETLSFVVARYYDGRF